MMGLLELFDATRQAQPTAHARNLFLYSSKTTSDMRFGLILYSEGRNATLGESDAWMVRCAEAVERGSSVMLVFPLSIA